MRVLVALQWALWHCFEAAHTCSTQAKVPWLKAKQFEAWFWKQVRGTWLPAASAATVLARQYFKGASKDMWFTPGGLLQRVRPLPVGLHAPNMPHTLGCGAAWVISQRRA